MRYLFSGESNTTLMQQQNVLSERKKERSHRYTELGITTNEVLLHS